MSREEKYIKQLEETIRKFLEPIRDIPYKVVIKTLTGRKVLSFDASDHRNLELLDKLKKASYIALKEVYERGIKTSRPNEAGNKIEKFVLSSLKKVGLKADRPKTEKGEVKIAGYPDIEIVDGYGRTAYLECKTYSRETKEQNFRTFFLSPSKNPKITKNAFHFLLSFELVRKKNNNIFVPISWQLYTLEELRMQLKHEFNASNRKIYLEKYRLAEGRLEDDFIE